MRTGVSEWSAYGKLMIIIGALIAVPLSVLLFYPEEAGYWLSFLAPSLFSAALGTLILFISKKRKKPETDDYIRSKSTGLIVLFAWLWGCAVGALPYYLGDQLTGIQSVFESVSGWTTTGLTVSDVAVMPHIFLFYRSFTQYCGGLGFVLVMVMIVSEKQAMNLFEGEGHSDKLMPNLKKTARAIFLMYSGFLVVGTVLYRIAGMKVFEGILHTMSALSTAGFSTRAGSIGEYGSFGIELVTIFLMLIGITNFGVLMLCVKGKFRQVFRLSEIRFMGLFLGASIAVVSASLYVYNDMGIFDSIRAASLNTLSALSTTGYSTLSMDVYSPFALGIIIIAMLVGGGMGSTAGGLKLIRTYILLKMGMANIKRRINSRRQVDAMYYKKIQGKTLVDASLMSDVTGFAITYFIVYIAGSLLLCLTAGCGLEEGLFEFAAAFSTSGLSMGVTGTHTPSAALIVEMIGMILGRLEIFIVLTGICSFISMSKEKVIRKLRK